MSVVELGVPGAAALWAWGPHAQLGSGSGGHAQFRGYDQALFDDLLVRVRDRGWLATR
jgi:hypothetical protein